MSARWLAAGCAAAALWCGGCGFPEGVDAGKRREAFHAPRYGRAQEPSLDKAGMMLQEGTRGYLAAMAAAEPLEKKRLLRDAAKNFEKAIAELEAVKARTPDPARRDELDLVILHARQDMQDCLRQVPVTGE